MSGTPRTPHHFSSSSDGGGIRIKIIPRKGGALSSGKWLEISATINSFDDFLRAASKKLGIPAAAAYDVEGTQFDEVSTFREGDVVYISDTYEEAQKLFEQAKEAPGPTPKIIVGNITDVLRATNQPCYPNSVPDSKTLLPSAVPACRRLAAKYGPIVKLTVFGEALYVLTEPTLLQVVFDMPDKRIPAQELAPNGVFIADGTKWSFARKTLSPCFGAKHVETFIPTFQGFGKKLVEKISMADEDSEFDLMPLMEEFTFSVICSAGFSQNPKPEFLHNYNFVFNAQKKRAFRLQFFNALPLYSNIKFKYALKALNKTVDEIIDNHPSDAFDVLKLMETAKHPDTGQSFPREDLRDEVITLLVAGHKTTTLLSSWCLYLLSQHEEVEDKLVKEIFSIFGDDIDEKVGAADIKQCTYLDQVLKETLRLYPPAQSVLRSTQEALILGGYRVPKNSRFMINVVDVHKLPNYWKNPDEFDPERFTKENVATMHPCQWIPFGGGARSCIGLLFGLTEVKVTLITLLRKYQVVMATGARVVLGPNPIKPLQGIKVNFIKRVPPKIEKKVSDPPSSSRVDKAESSKESSKEVKGKSHERKKSTGSKERSKARRVVKVEEVPELQWEAVFKAHAKTQKVTVAYGSNQETCEGFAKQLCKALEANHFTTALKSIDSLPYDDLNAENAPIVFICSTYNGMPPDNATNFVGWLNRDHTDSTALKDLKFAVFGAGNSKWHTTFQRVPRLIHRKLSELGADGLLDLGVGDEDGDIESDFAAWAGQLIPILCDEYGMLPSDATGKAPKKHFNLKVVDSNAIEPSRNDWPVPSEYHKATVVSKKPLTSPQAESKVVHLELRSDSFSYRSGDHLEVMPMNDPIQVASLAKAGPLIQSLYKGMSNIPTHAKDANQTSHSLPQVVFDFPYSLKTDRFKQYIDITTPPSRQCLYALQFCASKAEERSALERLSSMEESGLDSYSKIVTSERLSILEVLNMFPSVSVPFDHLVELLPPLRPRFYSISSSPHTFAPKMLSLTVGELHYTTGKGVSRKGVCSTMLTGAEIGDTIICRIRSAPKQFALPLSPATPLIMISAGTGVAPFRAFIHEKAALSKSLPNPSETLLFFGCRNKSTDYLYQNEFEELMASFPGFEVINAFSREGPVKVYVQDMLLRLSTRVYQLVFVQKAAVFLCGNASTMAKDVRSAFIRMIAQEGKLEGSKAEDAFESLIKNGQFVQDVWG